MIADNQDGEWLTWAEASERLGIKPDSVKRRARSRHWPRKMGNDGMARVLIPSDRLDGTPPDVREEGRKGVLPSSSPDASEIKALRDELSKAQQQVAAAEAKADERAETIADLRARLDQEGEERRRLTAILTDQKAPTANQDRPFWRRFFR